MLTMPQPPLINLPKGWQSCVKSAVLHAIALARYSIVTARAWAADSINARVRLAAENDRLHEECALLREELRLKDTRMAQIEPQRRPHYGPVERMISRHRGNLSASIGFDVLRCPSSGDLEVSAV